MQFFGIENKLSNGLMLPSQLFETSKIDTVYVFVLLKWFSMYIYTIQKQNISVIEKNYYLFLIHHFNIFIIYSYFENNLLK